MDTDKKASMFKKFVGNTGWMMFRNIYSMVVSLLVGSLSARLLGPSNYGLLNYGSSLIAFFTTVSKLGMDSVVVAEMVRRPEKEGTYLGTALTMRLLTSILSFFAMWVYLLVFEPGDQLVQIVTLLQATAIVFQSTEVFYFWFQAKMEMKYVTLASMIALTITSVWRIVLLASQASVQWFAMSASISAMVCGVCIVISYIKKAGVRLRISIQEGKFLLSKSYHFMINGLAVTFYMQLDKIMLRKIENDTSVGLYSAASTIAVLWEFIPGSIMNSANPILVKLYDEDKEKFKFQYQMMLMGITGLGILVGIGFTVFSKLTVLILYGEDYLGAVPALSILIWATCFSMIGSMRSVWLIVADKNRYSKYFTIMGAVLNAVLNVYAIPRWGLVGASITTLVSEVFVSLMAPACFGETREFLYLYFSGFRKIPLFWNELRNRLLYH